MTTLAQTEHHDLHHSENKYVNFQTVLLELTIEGVQQLSEHFHPHVGRHFFLRFSLCVSSVSV